MQGGTTSGGTRHFGINKPSNWLGAYRPIRRRWRKGEDQRSVKDQPPPQEELAGLSQADTVVSADLVGVGARKECETC